MGIRELAWADFPSITELYYALYDEVKENPDLGITLFATRPSVGEEAEWFARLYHRVLDGNSVAMVAEVDGRAVGLCTIDRKGVSAEMAHIGVLGIMVGKAFRRRGFGKLLLRESLARCPGKYEFVELGVFATNLHAQGLYRSFGFRPWGTLPKGVRRNGVYTDHVHMVVEIPSATPPAPAP